MNLTDYSSDHTVFKIESCYKYQSENIYSNDVVYITCQHKQQGKKANLCCNTTKLLEFDEEHYTHDCDEAEQEDIDPVKR